MNNQDLKWAAECLAIAIVDTNIDAVSNCRGPYFMHFGKVLAFQQALISLGKIFIQINTEHQENPEVLDKILNIQLESVNIKVYNNSQLKTWVQLREEFYNALFKEFNKDIDKILDKLSDSTKSFIKEAHNHYIKSLSINYSGYYTSCVSLAVLGYCKCLLDSKVLSDKEALFLENYILQDDVEINIE